jgi:DNA-binding PadR family transcriptional regulator
MALAEAILAALVEESCSGYDLAKRFTGSVGFFWKATHQQIYRELTKLEDMNFIRAEKVHQEGRPDKKLYNVTPEGKAHLQQWIAAPVEISPIKDDLLVKIFAGYVVPTETIIAELENHRVQHLERLSTYRDIEKQHFNNPETLPREKKFVYLTLRQGICYESEWLAWCEEAIKILNNL